MVDEVNLPSKVVSFQDEAKGCFKLAQAEPQGGELRTVLAGMAVGWLRLADYAQGPRSPEIEQAEV
jgi:hypothetical protein